MGLVVRTDKPSAAIFSWKDLSKPKLKGSLMLAKLKPGVVTCYAQTAQMTALFAPEAAWVAPVEPLHGRRARPAPHSLRC